MTPEGEKNCPKEIIEVRPRKDGTFDEIVASGCDVHMEMLDNDLLWIAVYKDGYRQVTYVSVDTSRPIQTYMDDWPDEKESK